MKKENAVFLAEMLYFGLLTFSRFFDHKLQEHDLPFGFMKEYAFAFGATLVYLILFFALGVVLLQKAEETNRWNMCHMIAFSSVFLAPFYLHKSYCGTLDVYLWILVMAVFVLVLLLPKEGREKKEYALIILLVVVEIFTAVAAGVRGKDAQTLLGGTQFVVMILFFLPYFYTAWKFFSGLLQGAGKEQKRKYLLYLAGGIPAPVIWCLLGDYSRVILYGFAYYILLGMMFMALGDGYFAEQIQRTKDKVKEYLPIPEVFILYPLIFITFWMMGNENIPVEKILELQ